MTPEEKAILDELGATDAPSRDETARILAELGATDAPPVVAPGVRAKRWAELGITSREQAKADAAEAKAIAAETTREGIAPDASLPQRIAHSPVVAGSAAYLGSIGRASTLNAVPHVFAIDELLRDYGRRAIGRPSDRKSYGQRIAEARAPQEELDKEHPLASTIGSVVGGVTSPVNALAAPVAGAGALANIGRAASATAGSTALSSWLGGADAVESAKAGALSAGLTAGTAGAINAASAAKRGIVGLLKGAQPAAEAVEAAAPRTASAGGEILEAAAPKAPSGPGLAGIVKEELAKAIADDKGPAIYGSAMKLAGGALTGDLKAGEAAKAAGRLSQYSGAQAIGLERGTAKKIAAEVGSIERAEKLIADVVDDMFERGAIRGTTTGTAHRFLDELDNAGAAVGEASRNLDAVVPKDAVNFRRLAKEYRRIATTNSKHHASDAYVAAFEKEADRLSAMAEKAAKAGRRQGYSFKEAHFERTRLNDALAKEARSNDRTAMAAYADMRRVLSKAMDREARAVSGEAADAFKDASTRYYKYTKLQDAAANAIAREAGNKPLGLTDSVFFGGGSKAGAVLGAANALDRWAKGAVANTARRASQRWGAMAPERQLEAAEELPPELAAWLRAPKGRVAGAAASAAAAPFRTAAAAAKYVYAQPTETAVGLSRLALEAPRQSSQSGLEEYLATNAPTGETEEEKRRKASQYFQRGN